MHETPKLLVDWEPCWGSFASSVRAALARYPGAQKIPTISSGIPVGSPFASILLHLAVLFFWISILPYLQPVFTTRNSVEILPPIRSTNIIYFRGGLPEVHDSNGAETGRTGRSGGGEFYHPTHTIRIARGGKAVDTVVDAPTLRLPRTHTPVAALLAFSEPAPAAPAAAVMSSIRQLDLPRPGAVPPAPASIPHSVTTSLPEPSVIAPAPVVQHELGEAKLRLPVVTPPVPAPQVGARSVASVPNLHGSISVTAPTTNGVAGRQDGAAEGGGPAGLDGTGNNLVMSANAGDQIGLPEGGLGSLAMSPKGRGRGVGGAGNGSGIGAGNGSGSGTSGNGPGAGNAGTGFGSNASARGGTSPNPGPGGSGTGSGPLAIAGVLISGGASNLAGVTVAGGVVHIPSFGGPTNNPALPGKGSPKTGKAPRIVVIASGRAGGALSADLAPRGARVYTIYLDATWGSAVLQFADPSAVQDFENDLIAPEPLQTDVPSDLNLRRTVVSCIMDRVGTLRNLRVVRSEQPTAAAKLLEVLKRWKFRPVLRGDGPIEVNTVLGFGVDTQ
jgi:hypothetical protein